MTKDLQSDKTTIHMVIHGRVQGVFYRDSMHREAQKNSITGWVRNCVDGTVKAIIHGKPSAVNALVRWAHDGPQYAHVEHIEITPNEGSYTKFEVIR